MRVTPRVSVLTIVRGRAAHLTGLIHGLLRQTHCPCELVIAWMQDEPGVVVATPFGVRSIVVQGEAMPLAAARNRAAEAATGEQLILLDVDCIPSTTLVERYLGTVGLADVRLGEVLYLPPGAGLDDEAVLDRLGKRHPAKPELQASEVRPTPSYGELWGLSFAMSAAAWQRLGGMDERYVGYGAEETDFAARMEQAGLSMAWIGGARAYHQHHSVHVPPLQHFNSIIRNARIYRATWGRWCMEYWLGQFETAGLITLGTDEIIVRSQPSRDEIAASLKPELLFS